MAGPERERIKMIPHVLRNLSELDIENLQCGRITAQTMHEAAKRTVEDGLLVVPSGQFCHSDELHLADELNDMLEAARKMREANGGWVSVPDDSEMAIENVCAKIAQKRTEIVSGLTKDERDRALDALNELAKQAQELDMGYDDKPFQAGGTGF